MGEGGPDVLFTGVPERYQNLDVYSFCNTSNYRTARKFRRDADGVPDISPGRIELFEQGHLRGKKRGRAVVPAKRPIDPPIV
ncbi:hypothetical protein RHS01_03952 [Rhizoctonia solani]|uniref:Uncharacterized protein n=1 Tax=Rhizoctonia solani TaxID=456999 RepID=A0A8H7IDG8_9AGAM|nr:hypothetical protein RHS01_03952 [Rhizoctonia solani]